MTDKTHYVQLHGGPFDGLEGNVSTEAIRGGIILVTECPTHGDMSNCFCDNSLIYGYFNKPGAGAGYYTTDL